MARTVQIIYLTYNNMLPGLYKVHRPTDVQIHLEEETFFRWNIIFCKKYNNGLWDVYHVDRYGSENTARNDFKKYERQLPVVAEFDKKGKFVTKIVRNGDKYNAYVDGRLTQSCCSADDIIGYLANAAQETIIHVI